jgi:hypothetical protein
MLTYSSAMIAVVDWISFRCLSKGGRAGVRGDEVQFLCRLGVFRIEVSMLSH